ncbi:hypothetical protein D3C71_2044070 [compost metagenome]
MKLTKHNLLIFRESFQHFNKVGANSFYRLRPILCGVIPKLDLHDTLFFLNFNCQFTFGFIFVHLERENPEF